MSTNTYFENKTYKNPKHNVERLIWKTPPIVPYWFTWFILFKASCTFCSLVIGLLFSVEEQSLTACNLMEFCLNEYELSKLDLVNLWSTNFPNLDENAIIFCTKWKYFYLEILHQLLEKNVICFCLTFAVFITTRDIIW